MLVTVRLRGTTNPLLSAPLRDPSHSVLRTKARHRTRSDSCKEVRLQPGSDATTSRGNGATSLNTVAEGSAAS